MCTSLLYTDKNGASYAARTLELPMELPYLIAYTPSGTKFGSQVTGHHALDFVSTYSFLAVSVPNGTIDDLKVVEGLNEKGLTFSILAYAGAEGPADNFEKTQAVLSAIDLGSWTLAQFATVAEVKAALDQQAVLVAPLAALGGENPPFHYTLHDQTGASIVIEYSDGKQSVYDNPVGVMTNGPEFTWHMTNLNNYTFFDNVEKSSAEFRGRKFVQPDSGISTVALPSSNTSVGRFVKAVYYSHFTEKAATPENAIITLSHIMNNFDRPRGVSLDVRSEASALDKAAASLQETPADAGPSYASEYTSWTSISDTNRKLMFLRTYDSLNYIQLDLEKLSSLKEKKILPLKAINLPGSDFTDRLTAADALT